jgi:nicotinic acetylcholine receptor, invertebrate
MFFVKILIVILLINNYFLLLNGNNEELLINDLFKTYNKKLKAPGTIEIKFSMNLNQIINLIEREQTIILNAFIDHEWIDTRLIWNPLLFNNITMLRISTDKLWTYVKFSLN